MKIGVNLYPSVGGSGYLATRLGRHLVERGHIIHFVTYQRPFSLMWEDTRGAYVDLVDTIDYPLFKDICPPYSMALASKMVQVTHNSKLDLIHSHYAIPHALSAYMAREIVGIPYVITMHGSDVHSLGLDPAYQPVVKHTVQQANAVTTVAEYLRESAYTELGIEREIHVIPNFIDIEKYKREEGTRLVVESGCVSVRKEEDAEAINPDQRILLHVSNFRAVKRVVELVEIMKMVVDENPDTRLVLVGDGPKRVEVERKIEELDLCQKVHLLGIRSNVHEIMCSSDMLLMNSLQEGMPLVILEAMASRLPVITTPAGGIPELVRPGKDGWVTEGYEKDEFAHAIVTLLDDDARLKKLGRAGRKRVKENFSADIIVPKYEQVFEEAVQT